jgi:hypothetical protein
MLDFCFDIVDGVIACFTRNLTWSAVLHTYWFLFVVEFPRYYFLEFVNQSSRYNTAPSQYHTMPFHGDSQPCFTVAFRNPAILYLCHSLRLVSLQYRCHSRPYTAEPYLSATPRHHTLPLPCFAFRYYAAPSRSNTPQHDTMPLLFKSAPHYATLRLCSA